MKIIHKHLIFFQFKHNSLKKRKHTLNFCFRRIVIKKTCHVNNEIMVHIKTKSPNLSGVEQLYTS